MGCNNIGFEGVVAIINGLETNATLKGLYLYSNQLGVDSTVVVGHGLETNTTLTTLSLSDN